MTSSQSLMKHHHKALYMAACMESGTEYNPEAVNFEFDYLCKAAKHDKDKDKEEEMVLPVRFTVGVVMALCGLFITVLPFPPSKTYGPQLIAAGVGIKSKPVMKNQESRSSLRLRR